VIEKAYKKLRLDALVIQQGRLQDNAASKVRCAPRGCCGPALQQQRAACCNARPGESARLQPAAHWCQGEEWGALPAALDGAQLQGLPVRCG
jgi:hypothetical protein